MLEAAAAWSSLFKANLFERDEGNKRVGADARDLSAETFVQPKRSYKRNVR